MKLFKVVYSFVRLSTGELIEFCRSSIQKMTGNTHFLNPEVPLTEIGQATDELETNYKVSRKGGGKEATSKTRISRKTLMIFLRRQADYVNKIANGDDSIILSSGFQPSKIPVPAIRPVFNVIKGGSPGQVLLRRQAVPGATAYIWQFSKNTIPVEDKDWVFAGASSRANCVIENFDSLTIYWFRVAPVLRSGMVTWSESLMEAVS
jgi:hypothetical protein